MPEEQELYSIDRIDIGTGVMCFKAGDKPPPPERLVHLLMVDFHRWLQRNQEFTVRATLPIVVNGNTVAFHVWFD